MINLTPNSVDCLRNLIGKSLQAIYPKIIDFKRYVGDNSKTLYGGWFGDFLCTNIFFKLENEVFELKYQWVENIEGDIFYDYDIIRINNLHFSQNVVPILVNKNIMKINLYGRKVNSEAKMLLSTNEEMTCDIAVLLFEDLTELLIGFSDFAPEIYSESNPAFIEKELDRYTLRYAF